MNDANYIIKNIAMLKNNTINVKNLTNKFCLELSRNFGIERTTELEDKISELLAKYKSGEIDDNTVVESFGGILNISSTGNNNITSNYNKNNNGNVGKKTSKNTVDNNSVSKNVNESSTNENVEDISKDVNNSSNLENTVDIKEEKDNNVDVEVLDDTNELENKKNTEEQKKDIINNETISSDIEKIKEELNNISSVDSTIINEENLSDSEVVNDIKKTDNINSEVTTVNVIDKASVDEKELNPIVDIEPNNLADVASICEGIEGELSIIKITPPAKALPYATGIIAAAAEITGVSSSLSGFKGIILSTITGAEENDVNYNPDEFSWLDVIEMYNMNQNSKAVEATVDFFDRNGCEIVDGRYAILTIDEQECKYDIKGHKFYINGKETLETTVYIPSGNSDYAHLNTYTYFAAGGYLDHITNGKNGKLDENGKNDRGQETNSILIQIRKRDPWTKYEETGLMTKFINKVAGTEIENGRCRNIIGGDSVYGTHSLITASYFNQPDVKGDGPPLYDTVYCMDNAIICTGHNNYYGEKTQMSEEQVANLDGLNIYFVDVSGDPNLNHGKTKPNFLDKVGCAYKDGYAYTGLIYLLDKCPNAKVRFVYASECTAAHNDKMQIFADINDTYGYSEEHYQYIPEVFTHFANGTEYQNHSGDDGNHLPIEACKAPETNANYYYH